MAQKPKAVKYKVLAGYLLLFIIAAVSVWFVYTEILRIATPNRASGDNKKIIKISNTIADLYASEAIGRSSILTGSEKDYKTYIGLIDSIDAEIEAIKLDIDEVHHPKFDSIRLLLDRKKSSITEIIQYRKTFSEENIFTSAISGIYNVKDSIKSRVKPVKLTKKYQWQALVDSLLTPKQLDSLRKLPVSNDSLALAFDNVLTKALADFLVKENRLKYQLFKREQKLFEENRIISDQLRVILTSVENEFLQNSYNAIARSQVAISRTINTMAWAGAITLVLLIIFIWVIVRDLTSNQNYRKRLERLNDENQNLLRSKSMLMATVTHDLQTPLGSIIGFNDLLRNTGTTPKQDQYIANIQESSNYILKLVNDLLDFSRLENDRITIEKVPFNVKNLIEATCIVLEPIAVKKNIKLIWLVDDGLNVNCLSDPYRIKQALTNLITNAIKFTNVGSVEVTAGIERGMIVISVQDTGIGIAGEKHSEVFKEFTQAHAGIEKTFGGTGLGLTISKMIIELLEGKILLESEEGQGSKFTILLPHTPAGSDEPDEPHSAKDDAYTFLKGKKLLIIDDDSVQLSLMEELFTGMGVITVTEINSSAAGALLETGGFDMVLTDIQMPVLDGFGLLNQIRQHKILHISSLPVIALSGKRDVSPDDYISRGFTAYHPKPIQMEELLSVIAEIFGNKRTVVTAGTKEYDSKSALLYNLESLSRFTHDERDALKVILRTFIVSSHDNCAALRQAVVHRDKQQLTAVAHKMIPMLKQMEVHSIADKLMPVEDVSHNDVDWDEMEEYIKDICSRMDVLLYELNAEVD
jgi:signal transduction histidine kinase/CheY-like chemotaxis protein/HPt (histidine-containing phosphotransfer) domain-containing protein